MKEELVHMTLAEPPEFLFKAVPLNSIDHVFTHGLKRLKTPFIDAYETENDARIGFGYNKFAYIFVIRSRAMYEDGYKFYMLETGTWGTDEVPQKYLLLHG